MKISNVRLLLKAYFSGTKLRDIFSIGQSSDRKKKSSLLLKAGKGTVSVLLWLCIIIGFASFMMIFGFTYYSVEMLGQALGKGPGLSIVFAMFASTLMVFIFGFMEGTDILYKGKDLGLLRTLPVTDGDLITSRIVVELVNLIPIHLVIMIPALIVFYLANPFSFATVTGSLIVLFIAPLVPVALASMLTMLVSRLGGRGPGKLTIQLIAFLAIILLLGLFQTGMMDSIGSNMTASEISSMSGIMAFLSSNLDQVLKAVPTFVWAAQSLIPGKAVLGSLATIAICAAFFVLSCWLLSRSYVGIVCNFEAGDARSRRRKRRSEDPEYRQHSAVHALAVAEWNIIRSSSSFMFELVGESVIPIMLIVIYGAMGMMGDIAEGISQLQGGSLFPFIVFGVLMLFEGFDLISATSISRQGKSFELNRVYPVQPEVFVKAKLAVHLIATWIPNIFYSIFAVALMQMPWWYVIPMTAGGLAFAVAMCYEGLAIDMNKPYLTWKNPQQAVKQNTNGIKAMGLALFQLLVAGAGFYFIQNFFGVAWGAVWIAAVFACMVVISRKAVMSAAKRTYC
ncbi:MAG: hypothetical protein WC117_08210 [Sphaerochaetaceae bacterium]